MQRMFVPTLAIIVAVGTTTAADGVQVSLVDQSSQFVGGNSFGSIEYDEGSFLGIEVNANLNSTEDFSDSGWNPNNDADLDEFGGFVRARSGGQIDDPFLPSFSMSDEVEASFSGSTILLEQTTSVSGFDHVFSIADASLSNQITVFFELSEDSVLSISSFGDSVGFWDVSPEGNGASENGSFYTAGTYKLDFFGGLNGGAVAGDFSSFGGLELEFTVIPLPPAAAVGLAGLGLVAWRRRHLVKAGDEA